MSDRDGLSEGVESAPEGTIDPAESSPDFRALFDATPTPLLAIAPPDWTIVAANDARLSVTATTREAQIGRKLFDLFPDDPNDPAADGVRNLTASLERVLATKASDIMPVQRYPVRDAQGHFEERWWSPVNTPVLAHDASVALVIHRVEDVTETVRLRGEAEARDQLVRDQQTLIERLRRTEANLRASEEFNRRILQASADCIKVLDLDGRLHFMSAGGLCAMEVDDFQAIQGTHWPDFWRGDEHSKAIAAVEAARQGETGRFQGFAATVKGSPRWWDVIVTPITRPDGRPEKLLAVARDVTEQRRTEAAFQTSEESLRLATDAAEVGTWDLDLTTDLLTWSDRTRAMFGISPGVACSMADFYAGLHPNDRDTTSAAFATALDPAERATYDVEFRTVGKEDGIVRWVAAKGRALFDDGARCIRAIGTAIDITRRKASEERQAFLLTLADQLRKLGEPRTLMQAAVDALGRQLEASRVGYGLVEPDGHSVVLGTEYVDGVQPLAGTYPIDAFGPGNIATLRDGQTSVYADVEADQGTAGIGLGGLGITALVAVPVLREGQLRSVLYVNQREQRVWTADEIRLVEEVAGRLWDSVERARAQDELRALNATLELKFAERTRELMDAEEQLRQAQKMEAVGQLTGGIAHDFNNLLTGVIGSLDLMQRRIAKGETDKIERYTTAAITSANRAAALTHRLLAFSRRQPLDPKPVNANRLVTGMEELLRRTIGEAIQLEIVTAGGLWQTLCDSHQLESAILNLAINARDAMPRGGKLTIETCNAHLDSAYAAKSRDVRPGQYVCICVTDTGAGMSPEVVAKAFEPFFTTKPIGQGTGLGLSMIYGFARQSEGYAKIYSEPGHGTTMKIYLPRYYGESEEADEGHAEIGDEHRALRGEVVLVVEDEPTVRDLVVEVLQELGYRAIEAVDGPSGLKIVESRARLDLLVTDIGLPGLNGRQLADAARQLRPGLKILFMTGYAENATIANGFLEPGMEMITKPFAIEALATRMRDMIETPHS